MGVGQRLAAARVAKGLSVADVAAATRLRSVVIERIEAEEFHRLDEDVFVRAHLKSYAQVVGLDPAEVVAEYAGQEALQPFEEVLPKPEEIDIFSRAGQEALPAKRNPTGVLVGLSVVFLIGLIAWVRIGTSEPESLTPTDVPTTPSATAEPTPSSSDPVVDPGSTPTQPAIDPSVVTLTVSATAPCWFSAVGSDGTVLMQRTLQAGDTFTWVDSSQISVRIGNAGALQVSVNGVALGALGTDGQVIDRVFGLGDPTSM